MKSSVPSKLALPLALLVSVFCHGIAAEGAKDGEDEHRMERIFAFYSTTSVTALTTTTITKLSTCLSSSASQSNCQGRKKRSLPSPIAAHQEVTPKDSLAGSMEEEIDAIHLEKRDAPVKSGKRLTIWSTNYTTITITSTSVLASTTVTVTALCNYPGFALKCLI